ncbi:MAG TPA: EAL domain-containing protein [Actinomycetes bacterium]
MRTASGTPHSASRLFAVYAAISLVPVIVLGLVLASSYRSETARRGLAEARSEASLVASTAIEPLLTGTDLRARLSDLSVTELREVTSQAVDSGAIVRLRLRDLDGRVVFSTDGTGFGEAPDDEVGLAAKGRTTSKLTTLNADSDTGGSSGIAVVEVYRPLDAGPDRARVGVLEIYLPYQPIRDDISTGLASLYRDLVIGLLLLYLVLAGLSLFTTRRLKRLADNNAHLAEHDQLTGLPNRRLFHRRIAELTEGGSRRLGAVAVIDLDRFKEVNDSLGHQNGDELLAQLGTRLAAAIRPGDTVARLGGDEFGVILARVATEAEAMAALSRLRAVVEEPVQITGLPLSAEASIGFALTPDDGEDAETLLQRADIAMYVAKAGHTGVVRYDPSQNHYDSDRLAVVGELRRALAEDELILYYQPKTRLSDGAVTAVEALIRWHHPRHGLLYPDAFLPLAEQTGLIDPLTDWVIATALTQIREWGASAEMLSVSVNISARNLSNPTFADRVLAALDTSGLPYERLLLEITETALFTDVDRATAVLERLSRAGVPISLDDFGQGQTSLGFLSRLPLQELKIDRTFVTDMLADTSHSAIVRSVIELAHNLGFVVVAEGVEDEPTMRALFEMGCDAAQGYVLARPMPAGRLLGWMADYELATDLAPQA